MANTGITAFELTSKFEFKLLFYNLALHLDKIPIKNQEDEKNENEKIDLKKMKSKKKDLEGV